MQFLWGWLGGSSGRPAEEDAGVWNQAQETEVEPDYSDFESQGFLQAEPGWKDREGRPVVLVCAKRFSVEMNKDLEALFK
jgi:hypothetical protein